MSNRTVEDLDLFDQYVREVDGQDYDDDVEILREVELHLQTYHNGRHRQRQGGPQQPLPNVNVNPHGRNQPQWPPFIQRRRYLRLLIQNLLMLDHLLIVVLFPFSVYNILRVLFCEVTFSENDFLPMIAYYCKAIKIRSTEGYSFLLQRHGMGLLGKFNNIVIYYTLPAFQWINTKLQIGNIADTAYSIMVKIFTVALYTFYGVGASTYLCFATFFFTLCIMITFFRRYKGVERIMSHLYQTTNGVF